ncbi:MAG TPA: hypothetical protein EYQ50_14180 [Verrucomicrobiales bacterium]|nr:hypothetical protein [Verrucomicrobiales bacterium]
MPIAGIPRNTGCESCHGAGSKHVEVGGGWGRHIVNPKKNPEACLECHLGVEGEFHMPERHPVLEGIMNCAQCHDPHGGDIFKPSGGLAMARHNQMCAECHREQARTFVYEHEALREGCTTCHKPHGSINSKMLIEADANLCLKCHAQIAGARFSPPGEIFIGQANHTGRLMQGACWTSGCHTAVHGSNVSPQLRY